MKGLSDETRNVSTFISCATESLDARVRRLNAIHCFFNKDFPIIFVVCGEDLVRCLALCGKACLARIGLNWNITGRRNAIRRVNSLFLRFLSHELMGKS